MSFPPGSVFFKNNWPKLKEDLADLGLENVELEFNGEDGYFLVFLVKKKVNIVTFYANQLPGLCGCCVLSDMFNSVRHEYKGVGRAVLDFAEKSIRDAGYALILGSTNCDMCRMNKILPLRG